MNALEFLLFNIIHKISNLLFLYWPIKQGSKSTRKAPGVKVPRKIETNNYMVPFFLSAVLLTSTSAPQGAHRTQVTRNKLDTKFCGSLSPSTLKVITSSLKPVLFFFKIMINKPKHEVS